MVSGLLRVSIVLALLSGCTEKTEDTLVQAVRDFRMNGVPMKTVIDHQVQAGIAEGKVIKQKWTYKKINEKKYQLLVSLIEGEKKPKKTNYLWELNLNESKSNPKDGDVWVMKAANKTASRFVKTQYARKFASLGIGLPDAKRSKSKRH